MIVNNAAKIEPLLAQMEQWSILSNTLNYIQYVFPMNHMHKICRLHVAPWDIQCV